MKMNFLNMMLFLLGLIGGSILLLSVWFIISVSIENMEDIVFKFNLLSFLTGISYIAFTIVIFKLMKK